MRLSMTAARKLAGVVPLPCHALEWKATVPSSLRQKPPKPGPSTLLTCLSVAAILVFSVSTTAQSQQPEPIPPAPIPGSSPKPLPPAPIPPPAPKPIPPAPPR